MVASVTASDIPNTHTVTGFDLNCSLLSRSKSRSAFKIKPTIIATSYKGQPATDGTISAGRRKSKPVMTTKTKKGMIALFSRRDGRQFGQRHGRGGHF